MSEIESILSQIAPHWMALGAVVASCLVNLLILGLILGRSDRQAVRMARGIQGQSEQRLEGLVRRQQEMDDRCRAQIEELRRAMGRIELRQSNALPGSDWKRRDEVRRRNGIDKKHHVCSLARKGLDPVRIAQRLNMYEGEAELVLGLQQFMSSRRRPAPQMDFNATGAMLQ